MVKYLVSRQLLIGKCAVFHCVYAVLRSEYDIFWSEFAIFRFWGGMKKGKVLLIFFNNLHSLFHDKNHA